MAEFSELVKNFDKIRDYMRDFYIYGFKTRKDFTKKSCRTYDNEKRRIESYLGNYIKWENFKGGKRVFISLDSSKISENPFYYAWKSKSFTSNDIMLHFYILDTLSTSFCLTADEITNNICKKSDICFDIQTVRIKANEYVKNGILTVCKTGKALHYSLSKQYISNISINPEALLNAIKYYQGTAPFGVVGSYLMSNENEKNSTFIFKHNYIVHTLEDKILYSILKAIKTKKRISFINQSIKTELILKYEGIPLKIFISSRTGRRYIAIYNESRKRFVNYRLDYIKSVEILNKCENYDLYISKFNNNLDKCWGVSFGNNSRGSILKMKLYIDEELESYIINRLKLEGMNGTIERLESNLYTYTKEVFDGNEVLPWIKSFIGRIVSFECSNKTIEQKLYRDINRMFNMYGVD